ncbi:MAG TPA: MarC family NAAT transporter [Opitutaceae bacterium]|nr:MarC family NAAT transporter [Opitutaceae bacterium]
MAGAHHFWELILGTVVALLPIINPFAATPTFLAITEGDSDARREEQARRACLYVVCILVSFLLGGSFIMGFFGISIPGLRIAGGLLVAGIGMKMLGAEDVRTNEEQREAAKRKRDVSFTPLAMPILSGPGSIAVTIGFTSLARHQLDYVAIILGIIIVAGISYLTLRLSGKIVRVIGVNGMNVLTKIMGFLLLCVGVEFMVNGFIGILQEPALLDFFRNALKR